MRDIAIARRVLLRLLAAGFGAGSELGSRLRMAIAQPRGHRGSRRARLPIIAVDAGHGGIDPGAISPNGVYEKNVVLGIAVELARQLEGTHRFRPLLIRRDDEFIPLRDRVARARAHHADLFVSLHADALPNPALRGVSVFTLSEQASDREAAALAQRENRADQVAGIDLSHQSREVGNILIDLARRQTENRSLALAHALVGDLGRRVVLLERPHRFADFAVLTAPDIPSVLVELGCLSNRDEERLLQQRAYQQRLAQGLLRAIEDYWLGSAEP
ncbi:MAG: N-acetylmuramoyl-L-alanine amidase [Alphaproteobacteria bacterium]|nr:N-acetylmuramoyl-L-alanine amidase [Alphaproteobacteria bacterium]